MADTNPDTITYFGETNFRNERKRFGIKRQDRTKHMYVIGKTGMGKTTMLENMAIQDIIAGDGLGIVDPHGEFAEKMLRFVPESRVQDVVYFAPHDTDFPIAFNIMEDVEPEKRHLVSSGLIGVFKKIWPDVWSARMEYILSNAILALLEYPDSTLLGINRMLSDKDYRNEVVSNVKDPVVKAFWTEEFAKYSDKFMTEAGAAIQNKVGQFAANPLIRNIIGQPKSSIDMRDVMDNRKILIMNLSKGRIGEDNSRLIGAMLITKIYLAAMGRVDVPEEERKDFYLYVDEFQNFATESFKDILAEARKYRLNLILAHQYIAQMEEPVRDAVLGNIGTLVSFRVGAFDAEVLEKEFAPEFMALDIVNLGFAQVYLRLMIDGVASRPFSSMTLPPMKSLENSHITEIMGASRSRYATLRKNVEEDIVKWHEPIKKTSAAETRFSNNLSAQSYEKRYPPNSQSNNFLSGQTRSISGDQNFPPRSHGSMNVSPLSRPAPQNPNLAPNAGFSSSSQKPHVASNSGHNSGFSRDMPPQGRGAPQAGFSPAGAIAQDRLPQNGAPRTISLKDLKAREKPSQNLNSLREALRGIMEEKKETSRDTAPRPSSLIGAVAGQSEKDAKISEPKISSQAIADKPQESESQKENLKPKINFAKMAEEKNSLNDEQNKKGKILNPGDKVQF